MKLLPKWNIWKHIPTLTATEAVSLTLNIEPHSVYEWSKGKWVYNIGKKSEMCTSIEGFADRLFLFKKCFGVNGKMSLIQLANWSQSVGWNIPIELAAIAPVEPNQITNKKPISQQETPPGKLPNTAIGKLAVKLAWELECKYHKKVTANEVIEELQRLVGKEEVLVEAISRGVRWMTTKYKEKNYDFAACGKR